MTELLCQTLGYYLCLLVYVAKFIVFENLSQKGVRKYASVFTKEIFLIAHKERLKSIQVDMSSGRATEIPL